MSRERNANGFAARWETTAELARECGFPVKAIQTKVRRGELTPSWRTPSGRARWRRADFMAQLAPAVPANAAPEAHLYDSGVQVWGGDRWRVTAQPGRSIAVWAYGSTVQLDPEMARSIAAALVRAVDVAEQPDPACICRAMIKDGHIEMLVPTPACPVHRGGTP
jgi:hypothetical protein